MPDEHIHDFDGPWRIFLGALIYLFGRSPETYSFGFIVRDYFGFAHPQGKFPLVLCYNLPSFIHVFAFSLMSAGLIGAQRKGSFLICLIWFLIETLFEVGQGLKPFSLTMIPEWFRGHTIPLAYLQGYFQYGTFDIRDIIAGLLGALAAFIVAEFMLKQTEP